MANKLKDLQITKVDFVDNGANPEANIALFKSKPAAEAAEGVTEPTEAQGGGFLKRVTSAIAKALGATSAQVDAAMEEIAKGGESQTFGEKMVERQLRRTTDEIWDFCYALQESFCSILRDQDVPVEEKPGLMQKSFNEFTAAVSAAIPKWSNGVPIKMEKSVPEITDERIQIAKEAMARLEDMIQKAEPTNPEPEGDEETDPEPDDPTAVTKGVTDEMKIDKSKLSAEELATLESIEKKAGIPDDPTPAAAETTPVDKNAPTQPVTPAPTEPATGSDDIYKGIHPAVQAELERLRKFRQDTEDREILAVAKRYELLGKKPEELAPVLKSLKDAGGTAYADMIGVLDANLAVMQSSPAFTEIGKRGISGNAVNDADTAWAAIEKKAEEIRKSAPELTIQQAIDKACEMNPDLVHQYEGNV